MGAAARDDNCHFEFSYACRRKGVASIIISAGRFPERMEIVGTTGRITVK